MVYQRGHGANAPLEQDTRHLTLAIKLKLLYSLLAQLLLQSTLHSTSAAQELHCQRRQVLRAKGQRAPDQESWLCPIDAMPNGIQSQLLAKVVETNQVIIDMGNWFFCSGLHAYQAYAQG